MSAEEGDHCEHPAMIVLSFREPQLRKDAVHMLVDSGLGHHQQAGDTGVRPTLGHEPQDLALARREVGQGSCDRRAAMSSFTNAGSMTEPPRAILSSVSRKSPTSVTRPFNR